MGRTWFLGGNFCLPGLAHGGVGEAADLVEGGVTGNDLDEAFLIEALEAALDGDFAQGGDGGTFGDHAGEFIGNEAHFHEGDAPAVASVVAFVAADLLVDGIQ